MTWPSLIHYQNYSNKIEPCNFDFRLCLVVSNFNEGWLVVSRSLEAMEVHHGGSNVGQSGGLNVGSEFHSRVKTGASNSNWHLQVLIDALKSKQSTYTSCGLYRETIKDLGSYGIALTG